MILSQDTTWTVDDSPYFIEGVVQIPTGITLKVEPGVTLIGTGGHIFFSHAHGTIDNIYAIDIQGTEEEKIHIKGTGPIIISDSQATGRVIIRHAVINGTTIMQGYSFFLWIYDSILEDVDILHLGYGLYGELTAERNIFKN